MANVNLHDNEGRGILFNIRDEAHALVPEGRYEVSFVRAQKHKQFGGTKLYITFKICSPGPYFGLEIFRAYNFSDRLTRGLDLYKELTLIYGKRLRKNTKLSIELFEGKVLEVSVRTVKQNRKQADLPEHLQYSVIDRIVRVVAGGE